MARPDRDRARNDAATAAPAPPPPPAAADALEETFDLVMAAHGIVIPADLRSGSLAAYLELRRQAARLRRPRDAESEPASIFSLGAILRGE